MGRKDETKIIKVVVLEEEQLLKFQGEDLSEAVDIQLVTHMAILE